MVSSALEQCARVDPGCAGRRRHHGDLDLYVDGTFRQALTLTSMRRWGYEGNDHYNSDGSTPRRAMK